MASTKHLQCFRGVRISHSPQIKQWSSGRCGHCGGLKIRGSWIVTNLLHNKRHKKEFCILTVICSGRRLHTEHCGGRLKDFSECFK